MKNNFKSILIIIVLVMLVGIIVVFKGQQVGMDSALILNQLQAEEIIRFDWEEVQDDLDWYNVDDFKSKSFITTVNQERYMYRDQNSKYYLLIIDKTKARSAAPYYIVYLYGNLIEENGIVINPNNIDVIEYKITHDGYNYVIEKLE